MKDKIILNNLGLIHKAIKNLHCQYRTKDQYEEYYYAGLFGLIKASKVQNYNISKSSFLYICIKNEINRQFKKNNANKRKIKYTLSLNKEMTEYGEEFIEQLEDNYNLEKDVITRLFIKDSLNKLKNKRYKQFIMEYYGIDTPPLNLQEIAEKYGVSKQNVQQLIQWGLKLLRKEIE